MVVERYEAPESLPEVTQILAEGAATMFAGGTDVMPQTRSAARQDWCTASQLATVTAATAPRFEPV